jgi:hypothetical protein
MGSVWVWIVGAILVLVLFALLRPRKAPTPRRVLQARRRGDNTSDTTWLAAGAIGAGAEHNSHASERDERDGTPGGHYPGDGHGHGHSDGGSGAGDSGSSAGDSGGGGGGDGGGGGGGGGGD